MKKLFKVVTAVVCSAMLCLVFPTFSVNASVDDNTSIVTENVVELKETVSDNGFVHPGIGCTAETLSVMRKAVLNGKSPCVDYFEGFRRTSYASLDAPMKKPEHITNNTEINSFASDAQTMWTHAVMYLVTGNEEYRKLPVDLINYYANVNDFFPQWFSDCHIKLGKYVVTFCTAVEIMRYTEPNDKSLAVDDDMVQNIYKNCLTPMNEKALSNNYYFMNQHSYSLMGYLASTILGNDKQEYENAVEMTTVNGNAVNQARNGAIKQVFRMVDEDALTGGKVNPHIQLAEMGRDQAHALGNVSNLNLMASICNDQRTLVDPKNGTVTNGKDGVSVNKFLDDRLIKGSELYYEYSLGYGMDWTPIYAEDEPGKITIYKALNPEYRGRIIGNELQALYYNYKGMGYDMSEYPYISSAFEKVKNSSRDRVYSGTYIETVHNYAFGFWINLPETALDSDGDKDKANKALAKNISEYVPSKTIELEDRYFDLSSIPQAKSDGLHYPSSADEQPIKTVTDGNRTCAELTAYKDNPKTMVITDGDMPQNEIGIMLKCDGLAKIDLHSSDDYSDAPSFQTVYVPDTNGEYKYVTLDYSPGVMSDLNRKSIIYLEVTSITDSTKIDFDYINTDETKLHKSEIKASMQGDDLIGYVGLPLEVDYNSADAGVSYTAFNLPPNAEYDKETGKFTWTPTEIGKYEVYFVAENNGTVNVRRINMTAAEDFQGAVSEIASLHDPNKIYVSSTLNDYNTAYETVEKVDLSNNKEICTALSNLYDKALALQLLTPELKFGGLDYYSVCTSTQGTKLSVYCDGDPSNNASLTEPDMNMTLDFGSDFKVKAKSFGLQTRAGFPGRILGMNVYGSNDYMNWICLTENSAEVSDDMQILNVKSEEKDNAYRYLRFYMPNGMWKTNSIAYICDIGEMRIFGERIEDYTPTYHYPYLEGYEDGSFKPDNNMTRAEATVMMARLHPSLMDMNYCDNTFNDVAENSWYRDYVCYMLKKKFISADADGNFRPDVNITRGDFAMLMSKISGFKGEVDCGFSDIENNPNKSAIALCAKAGFLNGYEDGTFRPDEFITRAEVAVCVNRMYKRNDFECSECGFTDVDTEYWAYRDIAEASQKHTLD